MCARSLHKARGLSLYVFSQVSSRTCWGLDLLTYRRCSSSLVFNTTQVCYLVTVGLSGVTMRYFVFVESVTSRFLRDTLRCVFLGFLLRRRTLSSVFLLGTPLVTLYRLLSVPRGPLAFVRHKIRLPTKKYF